MPGGGAGRVRHKQTGGSLPAEGASPQTLPSLHFTIRAGGPRCRALYEFRVEWGANGPPIPGGGLLLPQGDFTAPVADLSSRLVRVGEAAGERTETRAGRCWQTGLPGPPSLNLRLRAPTSLQKSLRQFLGGHEFAARVLRHDTGMIPGQAWGSGREPLTPRTSQAPTRWHSL